MMVTARRIGEQDDVVRYAFGFDDDFDRVLVIDKHTLQASVEDGNLNSPAGAIAAKIVKERRSTGDFPPGAIFAC
ncbi:hypothetical protein MRQ36_29635 [Micromonospora sp. R77]|uniref:hypothetical protein n=1 Tax=Micromonospora sp. R77 TaxID=2925836 RepID=UPI001F609614|nr:hypothetical protein [Micromonospora sp. R77]MCI4066495.1 hypothetical protein [Micromonospora sp. R77]